MKTKKKFFLKGAGISLAKAAGISLALVMMFAACDSDGSSSSRNDPSVSGPSDLGTGAEPKNWGEVETYLASSAPEHAIIYIRTIMTVTEGLVGAPHEVVVGSGKTLVITGERTLTGTTASVADAEEGTAKQVLSPTGVPRLYIPKRARLTVASGGKLVLGGPRAETYGGIVEVEKGGALHIAEGATLAVNMSSRVWVNGENYDNDAGYVALNIESRSKLAIIGDFVTGDKIIDTNYDERTLIGITLPTAPVAVGAALVYNTFPIPSEEEKNLKRSLERETEIATAKSPIKVADEPADVLTLLASAGLNGTKRLVYSGAGALVGNTSNGLVPSVFDVLDINVSGTTPTLIIQKAVTQNSSVKIKGAAVLMEGASITVTRNTDGTPATLSLESGGGSSPYTTLYVQSGASIAVANGGTLDLTDLDDASGTSNREYLTLNGEITAAAGGTVDLPATYDTAITWGTTEATGIGKITLAANSTAKLDGATNAYIGPVVAIPTNVADYTWDATDTISSTVTLTKDTLTLKGNLSVTGASVTLDKSTVIESGVLTVANGVTLDATTAVAKLTVADQGRVLVAKGGILDFEGLANTTPAGVDTGAVTLRGNIEVAGGGTINQPAPATSADDKGKITQFAYAGGVIKLRAASKLTMKHSDTTGKSTYFGVSTDSPASKYQWTGTRDDTSYVDLTNDGMSLYGKLIVVGADCYFNNKATINSGATLTIAGDGKLTLGESAKLVVNGTIELAKLKADGVTDGSSGGILDLAEYLTAPKKDKGETAALTVNGNINVADSATLKVLALDSGQIAWGGGAITFNNGSTLSLDKASPKTYIGASGFFTWPTPPTAVASITLTNGLMTLVGDITANTVTTEKPWIYDAAIVSTGSLTIAKGATLTLGDGARITVKDGATLKGEADGSSAAKLALAKTTSQLVLEPGAKLSLGAVDTIVGDPDAIIPTTEADVTVTVTNANGVISKALMAKKDATTNPVAPAEFTVSAMANTTELQGGFTVILGDFNLTTTATAVNAVNGLKVAAPLTAAPGVLIAGKAGTNTNGQTILATHITFEGTVKPE